MTERSGGSDVSGTETTAHPDGKGGFTLTGYKFYTSAITSEMGVLLARIDDGEGENLKRGSRGLSAFIAQTHTEDGKLNQILVHRLKDKLGTKGVPTAELELMGTPGKMIGPPNKGVSVIATILNITRIYNAMSSVSYMRRGIALARDFSHRFPMT